MARFTFGKVAITPRAIEVFEKSQENPITYLKRHMNGDYGEIPEAHVRLNDAAIADGARIMSAYRLKTNEEIWIITEADRSVTTILHSSESIEVSRYKQDYY